MAASKKVKAVGVENAPKVTVSEVQEVKDLLEIKAQIDQLKTDNPEIFSKLEELVDRYNTLLEAAEKVVRARNVSCGPFDNFSTVVVYNAEAMIDELGHEDFYKYGGTYEVKSVYGVEKEVLEANIAANKIPEESLEQFRTVQRKYHKPKKFVIP